MAVTMLNVSAVMTPSGQQLVLSALDAALAVAVVSAAVVKAADGRR